MFIGWIFIKLFENRLLDFEDNREEIIMKFKKIYSEIGMSWKYLKKDFESNFINPTDNDLFATLGFFNRNMEDGNRFKIIKKIKNNF